MTEFIEAFKNTSYYKTLIGSAEIVCIYIGGSMCCGITDERSDYDLVILTLDNEYIDASKYEYLRYKDKKVHWYYRPIEHIVRLDTKDMKAAIGTVILKGFRDECIIYKNPKYIDVIDNLYDTKDDISDLGARHLFEIKKEYIDDILAEGKILEKHYSKHLYQLCLASYYLLHNDPDKDFLISLKRIRWQPVSDEYKKLAVDRLKIYKDYIENNPIDFETCLKVLYSKFGLDWEYEKELEQ